MVFITGGIASGKRTYAESLGYDRADFVVGANTDSLATATTPRAAVIYNVQDLVSGAEDAADLAALADALTAYDVVISTEVGAGVVPIDAGERAHREAAGRLASLLATRAKTVVRMVCGIPQTLKNEPIEQD